MKTLALQHLRIMALIEGASLIALFAIAMPLKYLGGIPEAVRVVGMAHGGLFLWSTAALALAFAVGGLSLASGARVFCASLIPFGGLWSHRFISRKLRQI